MAGDREHFKKPPPVPLLQPYVPSTAPIDFSGGQRPGVGAVGPGWGPAVPTPAIDPRVTTLVDYAKGARKGDMDEGETFGKKYFGEGNADIAEIIKARKAAAYGNDPTSQLQRAAGANNINQTMQTAMRGLQSRLAGMGVRGGAAGAMGIPLAREALQARTGLETNLAINDQKRRDAALSDLEKTITGERGGLLSSIFGYAGLGAQDRGNATQTVLGQDMIEAARAAGGGGSGGGDSGGPLDGVRRTGNDIATGIKSFGTYPGQINPLKAFDPTNPLTYPGAGTNYMNNVLTPLGYQDPVKRLTGGNFSTGFG